MQRFSTEKFVPEPEELQDQRVSVGVVGRFALLAGSGAAA
jgi:hypothetical protein